MRAEGDAMRSSKRRTFGFEKLIRGGVALALALVVVASAGAAELAPRTALAAEARATAGNAEVTGEANSYS